MRLCGKENLRFRQRHKGNKKEAPSVPVPTRKRGKIRRAEDVLPDLTNIDRSKYN